MDKKSRGIDKPFGCRFTQFSNPPDYQADPKLVVMVIYSELGKPVLFQRVWLVGFLQRKYNVVQAEEHGKSECCLVMR